MPDPRTIPSVLFAWVGEDEHGSGVAGLKQGHVPAGMVPLVATSLDKVQKLKPQMEAQAKRFGKRIRLVQYTFSGVLEETEHGG